jgi:adenine/guanine phosphoribosyltransferase-like PRPP-binding protein
MNQVHNALIQAGVLTQVGDTMHLTETKALYTESARPQLEIVARELVEFFTHRGVRTVAVMTEKLTLGQAAARALNSVSKNVACTAQAEKRPDHDKVIIPNHLQPLIKGQRVLIVHDFLMDPLEVLLIQKLVAAVKDGGGEPLGLGVIASHDRRFDDTFRSVPYRRQLLDYRDLAMK